MARKRTPISAPAVFEYIVVGRPASAQPRDRGRRKDGRLGRWREKIRASVDAASDPRGYEVHVTPMRAQIIWFSDAVEGPTDPDLDNIAKPFLDGIEGKIVADDRLFYEIVLRKVDINHQFEPEPDPVFETRAKNEAEFVYVRIEPLQWKIPTALNLSGES